MIIKYFKFVVEVYKKIKIKINRGEPLARICQLYNNQHYGNFEAQCTFRSSFHLAKAAAEAKGQIIFIF
jgi:hypothetical protein